MKNKIIIRTLAIVMVFLSIGCQPSIDDSLELTNDINVDDIELIVTQDVEGGNGIELKMNTPGVTGYWDYGTGPNYTDRVNFTFVPFGTFTFNYTGTLGKDYFTKSVEVTVDKHSITPDQDWIDLGGSTLDGKTWVFNGTPGNGQFWYMVAPNDPSGWEGVWWNAGDCCAPDAAGKMTFDFDGGYNYTYYSNATAAGVEGSFSIDLDSKTLSFSGANILGFDEQWTNPVDGVYHILSLTENEMILYVSGNNGGTGWVLSYVPE